jgi:hypothetical protein
VAECANFMIVNRLAIKDKWVQNMTEVDLENEEIWKGFMDAYWKFWK